ncbi:hypothetical protein A9977_31660 [Variovorax sp. UMC13]|nr:hypothetical protein [Variovorax sp. UMC13]
MWCRCWRQTRRGGISGTSEVQRAAAWAAFGADEEWRRAKAASEGGGPLLASQKGCLLASLLERAG